jgi:DNA replicative helicase MCM subunit Mcm2 (Cdc46/Mcm family)
MSAAYRVVTAERKEIAVVTIICEGCGSEVSVNAGTAKAPYACPSCELNYGQTVMEALVALGRFHRSAAAAEEHSGKPIFRFAIKQAD